MPCYMMSHYFRFRHFQRCRRYVAAFASFSLPQRYSGRCYSLLCYAMHYVLRHATALHVDVIR